MFENAKNWIKKQSGKIVASVAAVAGAVGMSLAPTNAHAEAMLDFSGMSTAITAELGPAITSALPIAGTLLAIGIGYKLFRRFVK